MLSPRQGVALALLGAAVVLALVARRMDPALLRAQEASRNDRGPDWQGTDAREDADTADFPGKGGPP
ncbi:MAG: hypothetical protein JWN86_699 [Planctomycetota bacterium]|nr:hypothetical protein [Planctomycetota bacterium]